MSADRWSVWLNGLEQLVHELRGDAAAGVPIDIEDDGPAGGASVTG